MSQASKKEGVMGNSEIIFLFLNENIHCDPSLEPSWGGGGHTVCFYGKINKTIP